MMEKQINKKNLMLQCWYLAGTHSHGHINGVQLALIYLVNAYAIKCLNILSVTMNVGTTVLHNFRIMSFIVILIMVFCFASRDQFQLMGNFFFYYVYINLYIFIFVAFCWIIWPASQGNQIFAQRELVYHVTLTYIINPLINDLCLLDMFPRYP